MEEQIISRRISAIDSLREACIRLAVNVIAEPLSDDNDLDELCEMIRVLIRMRHR